MIEVGFGSGYSCADCELRGRRRAALCDLARQSGEGPRPPPDGADEHPGDAPLWIEYRCGVCFGEFPSLSAELEIAKATRLRNLRNIDALDDLILREFRGKRASDEPIH